jgi:hypothetical protein
MESGLPPCKSPPSSRYACSSVERSAARYLHQGNIKLVIPYSRQTPRDGRGRCIVGNWHRERARIGVEGYVFAGGIRKAGRGAEAPCRDANGRGRSGPESCPVPDRRHVAAVACAGGIAGGRVDQVLVRSGNHRWTSGMGASQSDGATTVIAPLWFMSRVQRVSVLLLLAIAFAGAQGSPAEHVFQVPRAELDKALRELNASSPGRLPTSRGICCP